MAILFNKWLIFSLFPVFTLMAGRSLPGLETKPAPGLHPLHVSVLEVNHNSTEKTLEISCRIFTDDFETVLGQNYKTRIDLINPPDRAAMEKLVNDYIYRHIRIEADGKAVKFSPLGYEKDNDAIYSYFQVDSLPSVKKLSITNTLMHDLFTDQINLMHITVGGTRKSTKLNYPDKEASVQF